MDYGAYKRKVTAGMLELPAGQIVEIDKVVDPKNRQTFIQVLKELIDADFGKEKGFCLEINNQWLKYRKIAIPKPQTAQDCITAPTAHSAPKVDTYTSEPEITQ